MNITSSYPKHAIDFPNKIAVKMGETVITYANWSKSVNQTANWFHARKDKKTVGIFLPNSIEFLQAYTGAVTAGWIVVPLDTKWKPTEIDQRLYHAKPSFIITTKQLAPAIASSDVSIVYWDEILEEITCCSVTIKKEVRSSQDFHIGFTSGSTGEPKAFTRSHASWLASFKCNKIDFDLCADDHVLIPGSLVHSHFLYGAISTLFLGGTVHLQEKFSPTNALHTILSNEVSVLFAVPTMIEAMLRKQWTVSNPIKVISSGAKWEKDSKHRMHTLFPSMSMYEFYGASELSFVAVLSDKENLVKPSSVGKACHNVEIQIRRGNQELAAPLEVGKVFVKSPMLFSGYITSHSAPNQDEWFTVDDMGYLDEDGYLFLIGREKNMIIYGGLNIYPEEIENVLAAHPDVNEAAITSIPDAYWGELTVAVIDGDTSILTLKRWCKERIATYKIPRKWIMKESLPHTISGKIARTELRSYVERRLTSFEQSSNH